MCSFCDNADIGGVAPTPSKSCIQLRAFSQRCSSSYVSYSPCARERTRLRSQSWNTLSSFAKVSRRAVKMHNYFPDVEATTESRNLVASLCTRLFSIKNYAFRQLRRSQAYKVAKNRRAPPLRKLSTPPSRLKKRELMTRDITKVSNN